MPTKHPRLVVRTETFQELKVVAQALKIPPRRITQMAVELGLQQLKLQCDQHSNKAA
jgi:hypothetical protein